jgi:hypothetical protein
MNTKDPPPWAGGFSFLLARFLVDFLEQISIIRNMDRVEKNYLKILRWGIFLSIFTPLILYPQFLSIFHFPKVIIFRSIVEIMLVFYILLILANKKYRPKWNALLITITIFS